MTEITDVIEDAEQARDPLPTRRLTALEIAALKVRLNLTASELASCVGVGVRSVHSWLSGESSPSQPVLTRLHELDRDHRNEVEQLCRGRRRGASLTIPVNRSRDWSLGLAAAVQHERPDLVVRIASAPSA